MAGRAWLVELLGKLEATDGDARLTRFRTRSAGLLLAYLALYPQRRHSRDELAERFWPDAEGAAGRNCLKQDLASLRRQMEGPGKAQSVLCADRNHLALNPEAFTSDVAAFEGRLAQAAKTAEPDERLRLLAEAVALYKGELLPGYDADWILPERERLANRYVGAVRHVVTLLEQAGKPLEAISYTHLALAADPLHEPAHADLLRLYALTGQIPAAVRHYELIQLAWKKHLSHAPSDSLRALAESLLPRALVQGQLPRSAPIPRPPDTLRGHSTAGMPPPHTDAQTPASSLPRLLTRFFGREQEIARLTGLLAPEKIGMAQERLALVTLTGPGGAGKTRLALEAATRLRAAYQNAVWFVPLADVSDPRRIEDRILQAFALPRSPDTPPLEQIRARLNTQPSLLVLDNFEHLGGEGAAVVRALLQAVPSCACLVTSRQRLHLEGERAFPLEPLPSPAPFHSPQELMQYACVALFVDRAQATRADFQVTPRNMQAVADICARLEGLPLGLELAAARIGAISPAQMLTQLEHRLDFLVSRRGDIETRHRTLRTAIAWSYDLLPPDLQGFFVRLCVFRGGWTFEAAREVCGVPDALPLLEELCARSLIGTTETEEGLRFSMLESLREFGQEQMTEEEADRAQQDHARFFRQLARSADLLSGHRAGNAALPPLTAELENFRATLAWTLKAGQIAPGLRIAATLRDFWYFYSYLMEGCEWLEALLARAEEVDPAIRARAYLTQGDLLLPQGQTRRAQACYEQSLHLYREIGSEEYVGIVEGRMGTLDVPDRMRLLRASLEAGQRAGSIYAAAFALDYIGRLQGSGGDYAGGMATLHQSLDLYGSLNADMERSAILNELGYLAARHRDYARARAYLEQALAITQRYKMRAPLWHLGVVAFGQGDYARAKHLLAESLEQCRKIGRRNAVADALAALGRVVEAEGDFERAQALYAESLAIRRTLAIAGDLAHSLGLLGWNREYAGDIGPARLYFEEGKTVCERADLGTGAGPCLVGLGRRACMDGDTNLARRHLEQALALYRQRGHVCDTAFCLAHFAALLSAEGRSADAARVLSAIQTLQSGLLVPPHAGEQNIHERHLAQLRLAHPPAEYDGLWAEGGGWTMEAVVACVLTRA